MGALATETRHEIVRRVFPDLRYGGDPDIERYFELRKVGRMGAALDLYNGALRARYPEDGARVALLRLFRENDPRYASYQESLLLALADRLTLRIRANIDILIAPLEGADLSDAFRALKTVEALLARIPGIGRQGDTEEAIRYLERYEGFSSVLNYGTNQVRRALDLVREYDSVSRPDSGENYDFIARSAALEDRKRALEEKRSAAVQAVGGGRGEERFDFIARSAERESRRREEERRRGRYFDATRIKFSASDRSRIEIPSTLSRREDKVLAFCARYWGFAFDPSFERLVFLYSRKFGTRHFEIFRRIKLGRNRRDTDDEILSAVSELLSSSYNYSISGDLYMQVMWRRIRARTEARELEARLARPAPESRVRPAEIAPPPQPPKTVESAPTTRLKATGPARPKAVAASGAKSVAAKALASTPPVRRSEGSAHTIVDKTERKRENPKSAAPSGASLARTRKPRGALRIPKRTTPEPVSLIKGRSGSVSDRIRKLSGRTYDVYKEIFLERVRDHIRHSLQASQTRSHHIFDSATNEAEEQVYGFMAAHYEDPFMDWESSAERSAVETLGFSLPTLDPVIEACFNKL